MGSHIPKFLNTPPWSSDRDPQRRSSVFKRFGPLNLLTFSWGGPHPVISRISLSVFLLSFGTQRLPPAMRGSLWPSYAGHCCLDWSDFRKLSMASSCRILPALHLQSSTMRGSLWPFYVDRIHPVASSGHESSQWLFHTVYLIYANWAL